MMLHLRKLLLGSGLLLAACATQTFRPDQAPEYVIIRSHSPFYRHGPMQGGGPDASLSVETRVKLLRKKKGFSLVQLEDSRTGYVANENMEVAPPESQKRPFGTSISDDSQTRPSRKKRASASPTKQDEQLKEVPSSEGNAPPPDIHVPPGEVPSPTPTPEAPLEKPKFRL